MLGLLGGVLRRGTCGGKKGTGLSRERSSTENEMVGWHPRLNRHESEQALRDGEGQGSLACCSPWGHKESDMTERLNNNKFCF